MVTIFRFRRSQLVTGFLTRMNKLNLGFHFSADGTITYTSPETVNEEGATQNFVEEDPLELLAEYVLLFFCN